MIASFDGLNLHRVAGPDGLNNDIYMVKQTILASDMCAISYEILDGKDQPPSFLDGPIMHL